MSGDVKSNFRQSMLWLHTWAGLVVSTVLFFMFITGSVGYFHKEISYWMQPELYETAPTTNQDELLKIAEDRLNKVAFDAIEWSIDMPIKRQRTLEIYWAEAIIDEDGETNEEWQEEVLNSISGKPVFARDTSGGNTLYAMHYALHYMPIDIAYWIVSFCSMFMLVGLISGVVIHKQIFKNFFTFKPGKKQHSWRDMHNVLSVLPLPFHLMITYSGLLFLMTVSMPGIIKASYGFDTDSIERYEDDIYTEQSLDRGPIDKFAKTIMPSVLLPDVISQFGKNNIAYINVKNKGDRNAYIEIAQYSHNGLSAGKTLFYDGVTGELLQSNVENEPSSVVIAFYEVMMTLHQGEYADYFLRWLYFLSGISGACMIASGMILWVSKRRKRAKRDTNINNGLCFVERLNIGTLVGLPIGIAVYFWLNRLLPINFAQRADWEINGLFISWAIMLAYPYLFAIKRSTRQIWFEQLLVAAILFGLLPLVNFITTDTHLLNSLSSGHWVLASVDLTLLVFALCFAYGAYRLWLKESAFKIHAIARPALKTHETSFPRELDI